jgi:hypothetical protein
MTTQTRLLATVLLGVAIAVVLRLPAVPLRAQSADPCTTSALANAPAGTRRSAAAASASSPKTGPLQHDNRWSHLDSLWAHRAALAQRRVTPLSFDTRATQDVGDIAVLQDSGDLVMKANPLDLGNVGLRLTPNINGGYDVSRAAYGFRQALTTRLTLADDDTRDVALPFAFSFFGKAYNHVFVNSDGNLTFDQADTASTDRSVSRLLTGPPRVAPLFADLDPSTSGSVLTSSDSGAFSVTWCGVREYGGPAAATVQVNLLLDGGIEIQVSNQTTIRTAVVGVSPGGTTEFTPVDLTQGGPIAGGGAAVGEQFSTASNLDVVAASQKFLATHPDRFDNIVMFTDTALLGGEAFAYEVSVANNIRGINLPVFDNSAEYGSAGQLQSLCNMDALSKYPDDPLAKFLGENSTVSVMGQEIGHRWLAFLAFRDELGRQSNALLGRDGAHWSFFFDSDASVLEGNDIADLGGGSFRTVAAVQRYSLLDQYAMGLVDQTQVPPFFYVQNPANVTPPRNAASSPQVGVTFTGTRRNVTIDDVIAVLGPRVPSAAESPKVFRQAFVYVVSSGGTADPAAIQKLDRIRVAWDQFFSAATDSRMRAETRLPVSTSTQ